MTPARYDAVAEAAKAVQDRIGDVPDVAVVLGSGLGAFAGSLADATVVPYSIIPHWPASKVVGHAGELVAGTIEGRIKAVPDLSRSLNRDLLAKAKAGR